MEDTAHLGFKVPPPGIEFTLPSPKIGIEALPVVDPSWMPQVRSALSTDGDRGIVLALIKFPKNYVGLYG